MSALTLTPRRKRRLTSAALTALAYLVLIVMLAPIFWLLVGATQKSSALSTGDYDLLDPTFQAFSDMWNTVDFG